MEICADLQDAEVSWQVLVFLRSHTVLQNKTENACSYGSFSWMIALAHPSDFSIQQTAKSWYNVVDVSSLA